jgi:hypothetical protein
VHSRSRWSAPLEKGGQPVATEVSYQRQFRSQPVAVTRPIAFGEMNERLSARPMHASRLGDTMQLRFPIPQPRSELWVAFARGILAVTLGAALALSPYLHLHGMMGTLGMYAVTDGVLATLFPSRPARRFLWAEAAASILLGLLMMLALPDEHTLLWLFCLRNLFTAGIEVFEARTLDRGVWLEPQRPHAYLAYAGLSSTFFSLAFMITALFGYGALDLHVCLAGQLSVWAALVITYALRARKTGLLDADSSLVNSGQSTV